MVIMAPSSKAFIALHCGVDIKTWKSGVRKEETESLIERRCEYWQFGSCSLLRADGKKMMSCLRSTSAEHTGLLMADIGKSLVHKRPHVMVRWFSAIEWELEKKEETYEAALSPTGSAVRAHFNTCCAADMPWLNLKHKLQTCLPGGCKCSQPNS